MITDAQKGMLPPGPWRRNGADAVLDATGRVLRAVGGNARRTSLAEAIASIPDLLERIEELEADLKDARDEAAGPGREEDAAMEALNEKLIARIMDLEAELLDGRRSRAEGCVAW